MVTHSRPNLSSQSLQRRSSAPPRLAATPPRPQRRMAHELARNAAPAGGSPSPGHPAPGRWLARSRPPCSRPAARQIPAAPSSTCSPTPYRRLALHLQFRPQPADRRSPVAPWRSCARAARTGTAAGFQSLEILLEKGPETKGVVFG
ncbi:CASP-like protein 4A1 [Sorghum bicolor]|uniref:CASP-like protein 4A1 n=1 Tax=Sorghum bicolor TaxID=4558 RepID=UPI000B42611F|nr:CASP-like protein 4A1 [Sorghum bicolor]|eukprot:XP_021317398.1 CASP-like protein 4A1 [Sorghum bicolor]